MGAGVTTRALTGQDTTLGAVATDATYGAMSAVTFYGTSMAYERVTAPKVPNTYIRDHLAAAEEASRSGRCEGGSTTVEVNGKTVIMDNNTFNPNLVDKQGRTNIQRMEQGLAPIGTDGKSVNIHHIDQTNNGPVMEITATEHQMNYNNLHTNVGQSPSQINRGEFNSWRRGYWEWRSNNFN